MVVLFPVVFFTLTTSAQFYNGHQMTFGKNRVQYLSKYWKYHRYEKFDTYFYKNGDSTALTVAQLAEKRIPEIENFFGYGLQKRLIFICYKSLSDFRESNIGYDSGNENSNIGGVTRIVDNKIFIYYESDFKSIDKQIISGITQVLINDMLYSGSFSNRFTNSSLIELPPWYEKGLISFLSEEWSFETENIIKDGFQSKTYKKINRLSGENAKYAGHSFWYFIGETYGKEVIPNIVYMTRINKNAESGFRYVLGLSLKELTPLWKDFYSERFNKDLENNITNDKNKITTKGKKDEVITTAKMSPDGRYIAYVSNQFGLYKVILLNTQTQKTKILRRKGHKLDQITDYSYPTVCWHPNSNILVFFTEEAGYARMYFYNIKDEKLSSRNILFFDKILSASYSDDGFLLAMSAVIDGKTDIFVYNISAGNFDRLTNDPAGDFTPEFIDNSSKIIFSSDNRTYEIPDEQYLPKDLYIINLYSKSNKIERLTNTPYLDESFPMEIVKNKYLSLTDKTGIVNREYIRYDSIVSYIDTAIHYRYFIKEELVSDLSRNIQTYDVNGKTGKIRDIVFNNNRFYIINDSLNSQKSITQNFKTDFRKILTQKIKYNDSLNLIQLENEKIQKLKTDSLRNNPPENLLHPDSIPIDVNNYIFETERKIKYYEINPIIDTLQINEDSTELLPTFNYLTNFYTNHLIQQVDFGFLSNSYQAFTGGAYYFNPGLNVFTKIGIYDLFEDYRISGGFRLGANLNSFEYLLSLEDVKKRYDKELVYHRQTYTDVYGDPTGYYYGKLFLNEFYYILKYPFDQVSSVKATVSLRHDKGVYLSTEAATLAEPSFHQIFAGVKLEYNFDNVKNLGVNLYDGTRFKVFSEFYQSVDQDYTNLLVLGGDFRFYKKIHRDFIFAARFGASTSFGKSKLLYYLGGVDNWTILNPTKQRFDYSVNINTDESYVYQAVATNMRGFLQNARNGTSFIVLNNELRFPLFRYIANRPLNSALLNNFQIIGFADAGSAWSGISPLDDANAYKTEIVRRGPITVVIDKNRWPVIFGYGFGLRTKVLGYFVRMDWAWGIDNYVILPRVFYLSLNLDF